MRNNCFVACILSICFSVESNTTWSYFVFAQQWPPAACLQVPKGKCKIPDEVSDWSIHGLWPTSDKGYPSFCNSSWPFDPDVLQPILHALEEKWPNIYADSTETVFWKHEWLKHGTCATDLDTFDTEKKYFWQSLKLHDKYNIHESTTPAEDRCIVLSAKRNRRTTAQQVANQFLAASGKQISRKTVARRLTGGGLYAHRPVVCVPLTRQHCTARLQWCHEHHNWAEQDWACVLFSDESRFSLSSDCRRQLIWHESGTAYRPENIQEKDRYPTCSIMVWASIMINGRTRLHVVANGTMTGQRYIDEVLLPHVRLFRGAVGDKFVFMEDNTTCHRILAVQDCLDSEGIQHLVWPARSPDLNPIENVWDALGRQFAGRNYPPTNKNTLIRALTEEWDKLSQQLLDNVVQSMVRVECCITLHGGHIPY
ncbi:ribonuclease Oy [Trichonephila clavipes]|nr:ribonuclease Oy [Trichonephila clavipes]